MVIIGVMRALPHCFVLPGKVVLGESIGFVLLNGKRLSIPASNHYPFCSHNSFGVTCPLCSGLKMVRLVCR